LGIKSKAAKTAYKRSHAKCALNFVENIVKLLTTIWNCDKLYSKEGLNI
jgi:hypothetical protein